MKLFSAPQIQKWDAFTLQEEGIASIELMERAAYVCFRWLIDNGFTRQRIHIFCGKGNNGGDGLVIARMLLENNVPVTVYILETGKAGTNDFQENLQKLHAFNTDIHFIQSAAFFPSLQRNELIIDALFGSGLNKPLTGVAAELVQFINNTGVRTVSIDIPSGMFIDKSTMGHICVTANHTLSFQQLKLAFLVPENEPHTGEVHILSIGLSNKFENAEPSAYEIIDKSILRALLRPRRPFAHKGDFGHAALIAGSYGMMGAAMLAAKACLYSGTGKLTCYVPACGYEMMQASIPEAMCRVMGEYHLQESMELHQHSSIGIGPGIGMHEDTAQWLLELLPAQKTALVLDADALNIIAASKEATSNIPSGSVITPHPKEFERLFGKTNNDFERLDLAIQKAAALNMYIVLKGHYTAIITPRGKIYFNNTGNAGMAKAGMGDTLTGIITGLIAQHYPLPEAAILAVSLHGLAGDIAAEKYSQQAMQAGDLINCIGSAWKILEE